MTTTFTMKPEPPIIVPAEHRGLLLCALSELAVNARHRSTHCAKDMKAGWRKLERGAKKLHWEISKT